MPIPYGVRCEAVAALSIPSRLSDRAYDAAAQGQDLIYVVAEGDVRCNEPKDAKSLGEQGSSQIGLAKNEAQQRVVDAPASTTSPPCSPSDSAAQGRDTASERVAYGLRGARDRRLGDEVQFEYRRKLAVEGLQGLDELRKLLVEADSFISHMLYRGSWPGERWDVERLIGRLRKEGDPLA